MRSASGRAGFTIIEVMIVLAIAGFITLLVFQAIPALQRGNRNSSRKQDVARLLGAVSRYELNNSGSMPVCAAGACGGVFMNNLKLNYYDPAKVAAEPVPAGSATARADPDSEAVVIKNHYICDYSTVPVTASSKGAGYRDVVALYKVESGNGNFLDQCMQL